MIGCIYLAESLGSPGSSGKKRNNHSSVAKDIDK